jgi:hypothetical protein
LRGNWTLNAPDSNTVISSGSYEAGINNLVLGVGLGIQL